jgi:ABC-type amino acid transport substrate-binding protein
MRLIGLILVMLGTPALGQPVSVTLAGSYPPYVTVEANGAAHGFDVDLIGEVCRRNGWDCTYRNLNLEQALQSVSGGRTDVVIGALAMTRAREALGDFTCAYLHYPVRSDVFFALDPRTDPGRTSIAVQGDSIHADAVQAAGLWVREFPSYDQAIRSVLDGQNGAYFGTGASLEIVPGASQRLVAVGQLRLEAAGVGFLVSEARPDVLAAINRTLADLEASGFLRAQHRRWFPGEPLHQGSEQANACRPALMN